MVDIPTSPQDATDRSSCAFYPKKGSSRWRRYILAIVTLVLSAGCGDLGSPAGGGDEVSANGNSEGGIGTRVKDGQFTFVVNSVRCGKRSLGQGMFKAEAQGEFCLVAMKVKNTGNEPQFMDSGSQYLFIGDKKYSASSDALIAIEEFENFFLEEINPGNSVKGIVVFDIPKGGEPDRLELHDSAFSGGVTVNI